mmetsp:Transcript_11118/g.35311  ORF Transcript_11118/g.35311 Transcript_11118/m.35311 type:complete len:97 (-) Transcript_11118:1751-2041(-)
MLSVRTIRWLRGGMTGKTRANIARVIAAVSLWFDDDSASLGVQNPEVRRSGPGAVRVAPPPRAGGVGGEGPPRRGKAHRAAEGGGAGFGQGRQVAL